MASMSTVTSVTLPSHLYPNIETRINDNSIRTYTRNTDGNFKMLAVCLMLKGKDGQIITVDKGIDDYDEQFGVGPCSIYGQAHLNARAAAATGKVTLQVLRLTAKDATYANVHVYVHYRVVDVTPESAVGKEGEPETTSAKKLQVMFTTKTSSIRDLSELATSAPAIDEVKSELEDVVGADQGWETMHFMSVAYVGRGKCGNNFSFRLTNHARSDKTSAYKNYYLGVFEGTTQKEEARVTFYPDALVGSNSIYIENVVNDEDTGEGSNLIRVAVNEAVIPSIFSAYKQYVDPNTALTEKTFDPILGINKILASSASTSLYAYNNDVSISGYEILDNADLKTVQLNAALGIKLGAGSDGAFDTSNPDTVPKRQDAIDKRFIDAFSGEIDRKILSKYRCPLDFVLDANFSTDVKVALATFTSRRAQDFRNYFDLNTDLVARTDAYEAASAYDSYINEYTMSIDAYYGKIKDPYNKKVITVTSTYNLAINLPLHWDKYGGKHIPYAGPKYAVIDAYIKNSIYPVFDDTIDQDVLDKLVDAHVNYAAIDPKGNIVRATQTSRYSGIEGEAAFAESEDYTVSNLSEENNVLIALDIKKDVEKLVCTYEYNFNETSEINSFNRDMATLTNRYAAAQVHSITAKFERTTEEAELGVLHLYIAVENKPLIKYIQVDIDINRLTD